MKKAFLPSLISMCVSSGSFAALTIDETFEDGQYADTLYCSGNCPAGVINTDARTGSKSLKIVLDYANSPIKKRSEVIPHGNLSWFNIDGEYWIGFSEKLVNWSSDGSSEEIPWQIHDSWSDWNCVSGNYNFFPAWSVVNNLTHTLKIHSTWQYSYSVEPSWVDWVIHLKLKTDSTGIVDIWKNGTQVVDYTGITYVDEPGCSKDGAYLKMGIYKWDWEYGPTNVNYREVHLDNIKIGGSDSNYNEVFPGVVLPLPHFAINDRVRVNTTPTNVKSCPWPCPTLGTQNSGATGTIVDGPAWSYDSNGSYDWYDINFDSGQDGWVFWQWLDKITDTVAPSIPGNLDAWVLTSTSQRIDWDASTDNIGVTGYKVYKNGNYLTTVSATQYDAVGLTMGVQYAWKVTAVDAASNESGFSTVVNETSCDIR